MLHVWICQTHKNQTGNKEVIKDFNKVWKDKTGKSVIMVAKFSDKSLSPNPVVEKPAPGDVLPEEAGLEQEKVVNYITINSNKSNLALAARRLRRNEKRRNPEAEFIP